MIKIFPLSLSAALYIHAMLMPAFAAIDIASPTETLEQDNRIYAVSMGEEPNNLTSDATSLRSKPKSDSEKVKVRRNQMVNIEYATGHLKIIISARALKNGMSGDTINFLNTSSRSTLYGIVNEDGRITLKGREE